MQQVPISPHSKSQVHAAGAPDSISFPRHSPSSQQLVYPATTHDPVGEKINDVAKGDVIKGNKGDDVRVM